MSLAYYFQHASAPSSTTRAKWRKWVQTAAAACPEHVMRLAPYGALGYARLRPRTAREERRRAEAWAVAAKSLRH